MTLRGLWNYFKNELNDDANENNGSGKYWIDSSKTTGSKYFEYKTEIIKAT